MFVDLTTGAAVFAAKAGSDIVSRRIATCDFKFIMLDRYLPMAHDKNTFLAAFVLSMVTSGRAAF